MTQKECGSSTYGRLGSERPALLTDGAAFAMALEEIQRPFTVIRRDGKFTVGPSEFAGREDFFGFVPACPMENLGSRSFCDTHGIRYAYVSGAMAGGIGSVEIVEAMGATGMLGFFGAAGLSLAAIEKAIDRLQNNLGERPHGFNLIHMPAEPQQEAAVVDLYLRRGVRLIEASAYLGLTLPLIRYRVTGIHQDANGKIVTPNRVIAKVSRVEVASQFFAPPPEKLLEKLVASGDITRDEARLARHIPVAQDLTAEADSGGHTDNRPAIALLPTFLALRDRQQASFKFQDELRVGAAGGIATPQAAAAAFTMGAAYLLTGSINQACVESGTSPLVREMLAEAGQADVTMAPAPDMFEMGVKVQVLKRGTLFAMRGAKLYELYTTYDGLDSLPAKERAQLEKNVFRRPLEEVWDETRTYFLDRDPSQIERAENDPKHKMALVFRWYLGLASRWANSGEVSRKLDFQIWCGPSMGAFNEWVRGSFLERPQNRNVVTVALNLLYGAAVRLRTNALQLQGIELEADLSRVAPLQLGEMEERSRCVKTTA